MVIEFKSNENRDEAIKLHYREFIINGNTYQLEYCSGPSFLRSGRTDQLYMQITIIPQDGKEIEIYTLKRYPVSSEDAIAEHILVDKDTKQTHKRTDRKSLDILLEALGEEETMLKILNSFPSSSIKDDSKPGTPASDYDLMRMYFKHL